MPVPWMAIASAASQLLKKKAKKPGGGGGGSGATGGWGGAAGALSTTAMEYFGRGGRQPAPRGRGATGSWPAPVTPGAGRGTTWRPDMGPPGRGQYCGPRGPRRRRGFTARDISQTKRMIRMLKDLDLEKHRAARRK